MPPPWLNLTLTANSVMASGTMIFEYDGSERQLKRVRDGFDHCQEPEVEVFTLRDIVSGGIARIDGEPLSTPRLGNGMFIYAVRDDIIVIGRDGNRGQAGSVKHETLFRNQPVQIAGEIQFDHGILIGVNDKSGSYLTEGGLKLYPEARMALLAALNDSGVIFAVDVRRQLELGELGDQ